MESDSFDERQPYVAKGDFRIFAVFTFIPLDQDTVGDCSIASALWHSVLPSDSSSGT